MLTRRQFLGGTAALLASVPAAYLYATRVEPFWPEVVRRPLAVEGLPKALCGTRLVQASDLHAGDRVPTSYLVDAFDLVASLRPDILVLTGDLTDSGRAIPAGAAYEHLPRGRLATLCVLGNHDYGRDWGEPERAADVADLLASRGARVLRNEVADIEGLAVVGLDDLWAGRFKPAEVLARVAPNAPAICLSHNPDTADLPGWGGFSGWILAGHTHGGQCRPPFLEPPQLPIANRRYSAGAFDLGGGRHLYVNRGLGFLTQARFNARPEITLFELARA